MEKRIIIALQVIVIALVAFFGFTMSSHNKAEDGITKFDFDSATELVSIQGASVCVGKATYQSVGSKMINLQGWVIVKGTSSIDADIQVLLKEKVANKDAAECFKLPTKAQMRPEVTRYVNDGTNYNYSGYDVSVEGKDLNLDHMKYEVWFLYSVGNKKFVINSGKVLEPEK